jgi:preprotein translocase subunit SecE
MHGVQKPKLLHDEEPAEAPRAGGVAEVLPAVQQAAAAQGIEVVTTEALATAKRSWVVRAVDFLRDVRGEIRKVTWPTWDELKKATGVIIVFVAALGLLIGFMDSLLQFVLVSSIAKLF